MLVFDLRINDLISLTNRLSGVNAKALFKQCLKKKAWIRCKEKPLDKNLNLTYNDCDWSH